jgi:hypothetical protein
MTAKRKILRLVRGATKSAYCKFYAEPELRDFIQAHADEQGISFSQQSRMFIINGIRNTAMDVEYVEPTG